MNKNCNEDSSRKEGRPDPPPSGRNQIEDNEHRLSLQPPRSQELLHNNDDTSRKKSSAGKESSNSHPANSPVLSVTTSTDPSTFSTAHPSMWCLSFEQMASIHEELQEVYGDAYPAMTMYDVNEKYIKPKCKHHGTSIALQLNPQGLKIDVFVTHCWAEPINDFFNAIINEYGGKAKPPNFWICSFAIVQGSSELIEKQIGSSGDDLLLSPFIRALQLANEFLVVRNANEDLYSRIWCVCELIVAKRTGLVPDQTRITGPNKFSDDVTSLWDAKASNADDKERILEYLFHNVNKAGRKELNNFVQKFRQHDLGIPIMKKDNDPTASSPSPSYSRNDIEEANIVDNNIKDGQEEEEANKNCFCKHRRRWLYSFLLLTFFLMVTVAAVVVYLIIKPKPPTETPTSSNPFVLPTTEPAVTSMPTTSEQTIHTTPTPYPTTLIPKKKPTALILPTPKPTTLVPSTPKPTFPPLTKTTWKQVGNDVDGLNVGDKSGSSVSMSTLGDIIVVGAPASRDNRPAQVYNLNSANHGSAQVYKLNSANHEWNLIDSVSAADKDDGFGTAVSTSDDGTVIAIGAPYKNSRTGSIYIYDLNILTNTVEFIKELVGDNTGDLFGASVDVSGDGSTIIVGATGNDHEYVKVYHKDDNSKNNNWTQIGDTITSAYLLMSAFGDSVSISNDGNIIAVGAWAGNYVKIYQYKKLSNKWIDYGNNNADVLVGGDYEWFGSAISLSSDGNIVAIGAPRDHGNNTIPGEYCDTVRVFQLSSDTNNWEQLGSHIFGCDYEHDYSGSYEGVKLSDDGMVAAIGSQYTSDNGSVRIFEYDITANEWVQISQDIDGEALGDESGFSISLSGNGSIVAVGARYNHDNGYNSGHVRVYHR